MLHTTRGPLSGVRLACGGLVAAWVLLSSAANGTARPDPLSELDGCERWTGSADGNDPTVELDVRLCTDRRQVTGVVQWSSLKSGWNQREVEGTWSADGQVLTLADMRIIQEKPNPGWRFCTIDRYELERVGADGLSGSYHSKACRDEAKVKLRLVAKGPAPAEPSASAAASPQTSSNKTGGTDRTGTAPAVPAESPADDGTSGCGRCSLQHRREPPVGVLPFAPLVGLLRRRARCVGGLTPTRRESGQAVR